MSNLNFVALPPDHRPYRPEAVYSVVSEDLLP